MNIRCLTVFSTALCALILAGCGHNSNPLFEHDEGHWVSDIPFTYYVGSIESTLPHDNRIYESTNFLVFSDASSDAVKRQLSGMAEASLRELKAAFEISSSAELGIVDQDSKVKIYANRHLTHVMQYFPCGFIIDSIDSPALDDLSKDKYPCLVKHELMHVFQHLLGLGLDGYDDWPEVWFSEGIAEHMAGGGFFPAITTHDQLTEWRAQEGHINPISIHSFLDYPVPINRVGEYYPMFELAVRYLLHEEGQGRTLLDVKGMYQAMKNGDSFNTAFEMHMGMSVEYYEDHFYELIEQFL